MFSKKKKYNHNLNNNRKNIKNAVNLLNIVIREEKKKSLNENYIKLKSIYIERMKKIKQGTMDEKEDVVG